MKFSSTSLAACVGLTLAAGASGIPFTSNAGHNSGNWTSFNTLGTLNATRAGIASSTSPGVSTRRIPIQTPSNHGDSTYGERFGFDKIATLAGPPVFDGGGLPDTYELANTHLASPRALDTVIDYEPAGPAIWQDYLRGSDPSGKEELDAASAMNATPMDLVVHNAKAPGNN